MSLKRIRSLGLATALTMFVVSGVAAQEGTIVVVNKAAATATLIDMPSGERVAVLPTGDGPHELVISPDQRFAVVTDYGGQGAGGNTLTVIDITAASVARTIDLGEYRRPHGIVFESDDVVAVTSEATQNVVLVRISDGEIIRAVGTDQGGSHMVTPVGGDGRAYTSNISAGTISELDLATGKLVQIMEVAPEVEAITASPDGAEVWVGSNARGTVNVVSTASGEVTVAASGFGWPYRILITPDNRTALVPDLRGDALRILDRVTHDELGKLEFPGGGPQGITLSPDAGTVYLSLSQQGRIAVIDLESKSIVRYIDAGETPDGIGFSTIKTHQ